MDKINLNKKTRDNLANMIAYYNVCVEECKCECNKVCSHRENDVCNCVKAKTLCLLQEYLVYKNKELLGQIIELPCPLGSIVYKVIYTKDIRHIHIKEYVLDLPFYAENIHNFGKDIFLTKEEAEREVSGYLDKNKFSSANPLFADIIKIIWGNQSLVINLPYDHNEHNEYSLDNILDIAKSKGYKNGVITVIADNPRSGKLYIYGNNGNVWEEYGTTRGYY